MDIDGTIALRSDRDPYDMTTVINDKPNKPVILMIESLHKAGLMIIHVSGRYQAAAEATRRWLDKYTNYRTEALYMRPDGDNINDAILKKDIYKIYIRPYYDIQFVIDDRDRVVKMWRHELGLPCFQVAEGNF